MKGNDTTIHQLMKVPLGALHRRIPYYKVSPKRQIEASTSVSLLLFLFTMTLFTSCGSESNTEMTATQVGSQSFQSEITQASEDVSSFIAKDPNLSSFRKVMTNIHSLKTLTQVKSKQIILFLPEDAAFEKMGIEEKDKLLDPANTSDRHQLFKNSLVLHNKKAGVWEGKGETYGGKTVDINLQNGTINMDNNQARILRQIQTQDGHLLYIINNIISHNTNNIGSLMKTTNKYNPSQRHSGPLTFGTSKSKVIEDHILSLTQKSTHYRKETNYRNTKTQIS